MMDILFEGPEALIAFPAKKASDFSIRMFMIYMEAPTFYRGIMFFSTNGTKAALVGQYFVVILDRQAIVSFDVRAMLALRIL